MPKNLLFCAISLYLCRSKVVEVLTSFYHKLANYKKIAQNSTRLSGGFYGYNHSKIGHKTEKQEW